MVELEAVSTASRELFGLEPIVPTVDNRYQPEGNVLVAVLGYETGGPVLSYGRTDIALDTPSRLADLGFRSAFLHHVTNRSVMSTVQESRPVHMLLKVGSWKRCRRLRMFSMPS